MSVLPALLAPTHPQAALIALHASLGHMLPQEDSQSAPPAPPFPDRFRRAHPALPTQGIIQNGMNPLTPSLHAQQYKPVTLIQYFDALHRETGSAVEAGTTLWRARTRHARRAPQGTTQTGQPQAAPTVPQASLWWARAAKTVPRARTHPYQGS
jgi:hypothetical protein